MLQIELQPEVEAQLAAEAQAHGLALERYVVRIVQTRQTEAPTVNRHPDAVSAAVERILKIREESSPDSTSIKNLINEGRKY